MNADRFNPAPELLPQLRQFRLSGILDSLEARNRQALDAKLVYAEYLALLIGDEIAQRGQKKVGSRPRRTQFRITKTLEPRLASMNQGHGDAPHP